MHLCCLFFNRDSFVFAILVTVTRWQHTSIGILTCNSRNFRRFRLPEVLCKQLITVTVSHPSKASLPHRNRHHRLRRNDRHPGLCHAPRLFSLFPVPSCCCLFKAGTTKSRCKHVRCYTVQIRTRELVSRSPDIACNTYNTVTMLTVARALAEHLILHLVGSQRVCVKAQDQAAAAQPLNKVLQPNYLLTGKGECMSQYLNYCTRSCFLHRNNQLEHSRFCCQYPLSGRSQLTARHAKLVLQNRVKFPGLLNDFQAAEHTTSITHQLNQDVCTAFMMLNKTMHDISQSCII